MAGTDPVFVAANTWTDIFDTVAAGIDVETVIQNDPSNYGVMELCWGGSDPTDGNPTMNDTKGLVLEPGDGDFDTAGACWVRFPSTRGGLVRVSVRG